jgi:hypothetical protein
MKASPKRRKRVKRRLEQLTILHYSAHRLWRQYIEAIAQRLLGRSQTLRNEEMLKDRGEKGKIRG